MKTKMISAAAIGLMFLTATASSTIAAPVAVQTSGTFSCSTNAECKRKCEALGSDHTWKPNPGGSTLGTCTKKRASFWQRLFRGSLSTTGTVANR